MSLQRLASKGRHGDNTLLHIHPSELVGLAALTGKPITINPETGLPEMFSWKKLLLGAGLAALAIPTGGMSILGGIGSALGGGLGAAIGSGAAAGLTGLAASKLIGSALTKKNSDKSSGSEASKALDKRNEALRQPQTFYAPMMVDSPAQQPNLLGYEQPFQVNPAGISALNISPPRYVEGGQLEPEEQQAKDIVMQYLAALQGQHQNPQMAENQFVEYYGPQAAQDLRRGGMIRGPGGGMDDMVTASVNGTKALVSNDEFVIPADVVSGLGDGSSSAGARKLHAMMDRVRQQKTGRAKQPGKISNKVLPR